MVDGARAGVLRVTEAPGEAKGWSEPSWGGVTRAFQGQVKRRGFRLLGFQLLSRWASLSKLLVRPVVTGFTIGPALCFQAWRLRQVRRGAGRWGGGSRGVMEEITGVDGRGRKRVRKAIWLGDGWCSGGQIQCRRRSPATSPRSAPNACTLQRRRSGPREVSGKWISTLFSFRCRARMSQHDVRQRAERDLYPLEVRIRLSLLSYLSSEELSIAKLAWPGKQLLGCVAAAIWNLLQAHSQLQESLYQL